MPVKEGGQEPTNAILFLLAVLSLYVCALLLELGSNLQDSSHVVQAKRNDAKLNFDLREGYLIILTSTSIIGSDRRLSTVAFVTQPEPLDNSLIPLGVFCQRTLCSLRNSTWVALNRGSLYYFCLMPA